MRIISLLVLFSLIGAGWALAQIPAGKYKSADFPDDRKAIQALFKNLYDSTHFLEDNYVGIGAEGVIHFGYKDQVKSQSNPDYVFKSVTPVQDMLVLRIIGGHAAVQNAMLDVRFGTPAGDRVVRVLRTEVFVKENGTWYYVNGQGTMVMDKEELRWLQERRREKVPKP